MEARGKTSSPQDFPWSSLHNTSYTNILEQGLDWMATLLDDPASTLTPWDPKDQTTKDLLLGLQQILHLRSA